MEHAPFQTIARKYIDIFSKFTKRMMNNQIKTEIYSLFALSRCQPGWTNPNCDQCIVRSGCAHGTCVHPHDCLCGPGTENPDWRGVLCDEPICE